MVMQTVETQLAFVPRQAALGPGLYVNFLIPKLRPQQSSYIVLLSDNAAGGVED